MTNKLMAVAAVAVLGMIPAEAQSVADLLQKGIYAQQTAGDLDGAIQLFRQAINAASGSRTMEAQALYHMGAAQAAKRDLSGATQTFRELIDRYPEQRELAARLQQYLPVYKPSSAQAGFATTIYHDAGTSGASVALPPGWTATQTNVDSTKKPITITLHDPANGEREIYIWVRTEKIDQATLAQKIQETPDQKEQQMRKDFSPDFTIRRESVWPLQVGANKGLAAIADYTEVVRGQTFVLADDGKSMKIAEQGSVFDASGRLLPGGSGPAKRAHLFAWLWGTNSRVVVFLRNVDPAKLADVQPVFDSIVNTVVIP